MAEQESVQTQLDCLRFDVVGLQQHELARDRDILELVKGRETQAENMRNLGRTLLSEHTLLSRLVIQHETFVTDTVKALHLFQGAVNSQEQELHLLRDTVASLQQDVATLEEKFSLMEEVTNVTVSLDETDEGGAERAEMEYRRIQEEYGTELELRKTIKEYHVDVGGIPNVY